MTGRVGPGFGRSRRGGSPLGYGARPVLVLSLARRTVEPQWGCGSTSVATYARGRETRRSGRSRRAARRTDAPPAASFAGTAGAGLGSRLGSGWGRWSADTEVESEGPVALTSFRDRAVHRFPWHRYIAGHSVSATHQGRPVPAGEQIGEPGATRCSAPPAAPGVWRAHRVTPRREWAPRRHRSIPSALATSRVAQLPLALAEAATLPAPRPSPAVGGVVAGQGGRRLERVGGGDPSPGERTGSTPSRRRCPAGAARSGRADR